MKFKLMTLALGLNLPIAIATAQQVDTKAPQVEPKAQPAAESRKVKTGEVAETVVIESTITGNQEQPKTIYVLPWQDSVARIKMPAAERPKTQHAPKPLDREQFLRFIQAQPLLAPTSQSGQLPAATNAAEQPPENQ